MINNTSKQVQKIQREEAQAQGVRVMTYALGSGAEQATCKQIACETGGVFSVVGDGKAQRFGSG